MMTRVVIVCIILIDDKTIASFLANALTTSASFSVVVPRKIIFTSFKHSSLSTTPSLDALKMGGWRE